MSSRSQLLSLAVVAVVVIASAFAFVGFAAAEHRTDVQQQVATSSTNGASMTVPSVLHLYVVGPEPMRGQVEDALVTAFDNRGIDAQVVTDLQSAYDRPVLLVAVRDSRLAYNPITPSAAVSIGFEYAADGNVTQFGQDGDAAFDVALVDDRLMRGETIAVVLDDQNTLFRSGEIRVTDESNGVISWPGYQAYVLEAVGESTVVSLLDTD
jgi:hypothetical protein